ncbi:MAG TPA: hypothetical protein VGN63_20855 [Flavisolibacter sp.]|jgi:hypothetical protein|nr:hypothetical protein [Flavisolibacter sp.]
MQPKTIFANWTQFASTLLMGGALAWALKLSVIISTNGRIIDTGAAALLMKVGIPLLLIGSTCLGSSFTTNQNAFIRILAILLSPVLLFGACFLITTSLNPLVQDSSVWYAAQELPIAVVVLVCFPLGLFLYKRFQPVLA